MGRQSGFVNQFIRNDEEQFRNSSFSPPKASTAGGTTVNGIVPNFRAFNDSPMLGQSLNHLGASSVAIEGHPLSFKTDADEQACNATALGDNGGDELILLTPDGGRRLDPEDLICPVCGQTMVIPLPTAPLVPFKTPAEVHKRMCQAIQLRLMKTSVINLLIETVSDCIIAEQRPTINLMQQIIGRGWSCGLLLWAQPEDLLPMAPLSNEAARQSLADTISKVPADLRGTSHAPSSYEAGTGTVRQDWSLCLEALASEIALLQLAVGEEQVGGAFSSYTIRPLPVADQQTDASTGRTMLIFAADSSVRVLAQRFLRNVWFERMMLLLILIATIALAAESPRGPPDVEGFGKALEVIDIAFTALFTLEMACKMVVYGLIGSKRSYFRDPFNWLDFFIVVTSIASLSVSKKSVGVSNVLMSFRGLRPLRLVTTNRGIQKVVHTLFRSARGILNVVVFALCNYTFFAIFAMQLFSGKFFRCNDSAITRRVDCVGTFQESVTNITRTRMWYPADRNFDNFGNAVLTLFEVSTMEWWTDVLWDSVDSVDHDTSPEKDSHIAYAIFYVVFILIASFIIMQMFIAVVASNFNRVRNEVGDIAFMTNDQRTWKETQRMLLNFKPRRLMDAGKTKISKICHRLVQRPMFERFIFFCIFLNAILLLIDHYNAPLVYRNLVDIGHDVFTGIFVAECLLKLGAYEWRYFYDGWNRLDFVIIVLSLGYVGLKTLLEGVFVDIAVLQVIRLFKVLRIFRLIKHSAGVQLLFEALWYALPSIANVGGLMLLLMFLYSIIGVQLFYNIESGTIIDKRYTNFFDFWNAFQLMVRFQTMTDWNQVMHDCMRTPPNCNANDPTLGDCGLFGAPVYFISFAILSSIILMNLVVAIIIDNFKTTMRLESSQVQMKDIQRFVLAWAEFDPNATMMIPTRAFPILLARLGAPLGISHNHRTLDLLTACLSPESFVEKVRYEAEKAEAAEKKALFLAEAAGVDTDFIHAQYHRDDDRLLFPSNTISNQFSSTFYSSTCKSFGTFNKNTNNANNKKSSNRNGGANDDEADNVPPPNPCKEIADRGGKVHFFEALIPLARVALGFYAFDDEATIRLFREMDYQWRTLMPELAALPIVRVGVGAQIATVGEYMAAVVLQSAFRRLKARREVAELRAKAAEYREQHTVYSPKIALYMEQSISGFGRAHHHRNRNMAAVSPKVAPKVANAPPRINSPATTPMPTNHRQSNDANRSASAPRQRVQEERWEEEARHERL